MVMELLFFLASMPGVAPRFPAPRLIALDAPTAMAQSVVPPPADIKRVPWFPEKLEFNVKWGVMSLGTAYLESTEVVRMDGKLAYRVRSDANSNGFADTFYKVRDRYESYVDAKSLTSLGFSKQLREGGFYRDEWVLYDVPERSYLAKTRNKKGEASLEDGLLPGEVQDILSSLYYIRTQDLEVGREYTVDVNTKDNWPLVVKVNRREKIRVPAGRFDCFLVEPYLRGEGLFIQKGKRLEVWLTADERRMPVQVHVDVIFGHIRAELEKIHTP